ncbi:hypothetical protein B4589_006535 [Halolamina sp. CBA1230]|uniref:hypothetical protein n=1 Tax=Halolamina sp. CBA1230 TaxID=1853690 RepID=UPI0009A20780|nr:hypothetical protein [Halolamina sp. CBA1230]QKY20050.1 hypothetical protein B4589_006535 [Halolamina sp. CBA1230]
MVSALPRPSTVSRETRQWALAGGLGYALLLLATLMWAYTPSSVVGALASVQIGPFLWWALVGGAVVGVVVAVAVRQYGLVSPLLSVVIVYGATVYLMWQALRSPNPLLPGTPLDVYLVGWPLLLVLVVGVGVVERQLRGRSEAR